MKKAFDAMGVMASARSVQDTSTKCSRGDSLLGRPGTQGGLRPLLPETYFKRELPFWAILDSSEASGHCPRLLRARSFLFSFPKNHSTFNFKRPVSALVTNLLSPRKRRIKHVSAIAGSCLASFSCCPRFLQSLRNRLSLKPSLSPGPPLSTLALRLQGLLRGVGTLPAPP